MARNHLSTHKGGTVKIGVASIIIPKIKVGGETLFIILDDGSSIYQEQVIGSLSYYNAEQLKQQLDKFYTEEYFRDDEKK